MSLSSLPRSAKWLLTLFLLLVGAGYLVALGNLYHRHGLADGREGLSLDDLRVTFHGLDIKDDAPAGEGARSRMLEMVEPGGEMRKHLSDGGPPAIRALETWLGRGATKAEFDLADLAQAGDPSARAAIDSNCLLCHNPDGEKADAPYGPDMFTIDYDMVYLFAAPGTAVMTSSSTTGTVPTKGPQTQAHLFLVTHIHMLSIPVFTLIVSGLFLLADEVSRNLKNALGVVPMLMLVFDFSSWWLARISEPLIYIIVAAGAAYGVTFGFQLLAVAYSIWLGKRRTAASK